MKNTTLVMLVLSWLGVVMIVSLSLQNAGFEFNATAIVWSIIWFAVTTFLLVKRLNDDSNNRTVTILRIICFVINGVSIGILVPTLIAIIKLVPGFISGIH